MAPRRLKTVAQPSADRPETGWEPAWDDGEPMEMEADAPAPLSSRERVKEACRLIRLARSHWDAHHNSACRTVRTRALALYQSLSQEEKEEVPQVLRVWLRYRSEKYYGRGTSRPRKRARGRGESGGA